MPGKGLAATDIQTKLEDLATINTLHAAFGDLAFPAARRYHHAMGYAAGVERLACLVAAGDFDREKFLVDPASGVAAWLQGFFAERGGNQPEIWSEGRTAYLRTRACKTCLVVEAEKQLPSRHREVCFVYCRAWAEGYVTALVEMFPSITVHYYNVSSRRHGEGEDCTEAFQVIAG